MTLSRVRFGVLASRTASMGDWAARARTIERLGYSTLLAPDHFGGRMSPFPALAAAACATTTLQLGTLVINLPVWDIAHLARDAATVHVLSGGRLELGLGAGWSVHDERATGNLERSRGERREILEAKLPVLTTLLAGDRIRLPPVGRSRPSFALDIPELDRFPGPRLVLGATGHPLIRWAATVAETIVLAARPQPSGVDVPESASRAALRDRVDWIRAATDRPIEVALPIKRVDIHPRMGSIQAAAPEGRPPMDRPDHLTGSLAQVIDLVEDLRSRFGVSYLIIRESAMSRFAPVVREFADRD